jgi:hypothetical protein
MLLNRLYRHLLLPAVVPAVFFAVAALPVDALGCRNRGLLAATIALVGSVAGLGAASIGLRGRMRGDLRALWWSASALVLAIPAIAIVLIAS